jgi:AbrB family looped-hinge helix DNA binding protein
MEAAKKGRERSNVPTRVDTSGRTLIPADVRRHLGIEGGGYVMWEKDGDGARVHAVEWTKPKKRT